MGELLSQYNVFAAFGMTLLLTFFSAIGALVIGTIVAILRVSPVPLLQRVGALYVNIVRNTPLTLIIIACNIVMIVNLGLSFSDDLARNNIIWAIIGLSVYHAAFVCESLAQRCQHGPGGSGGGGPVGRPDLHPEPARGHAPPGLPRRDHAARQHPHRADQEHHGRHRDRRGRDRGPPA